jgi:hypothetical protein
MRSFLAALRTLVLPYGATTGPRVILDGIMGLIRLIGGSGSSMELDPTSTIPIIRFRGPTGTQFAFVNAPPDTNGVPQIGVNTGMIDSARVGRKVFYRMFLSSPGGHMAVVDINQLAIGGEHFFSETVCISGLRDTAGTRFAYMWFDQAGAFLRYQDGPKITLDGTQFLLALHSDPTKGIMWSTAKQRLAVIGEDWHAATLLAGWTNLGAPYTTAAYYLQPDGMVRLRGILVGGTKTDGTVIATLPAGYRPTADEIITVGNATSGGVLPELRIRANGNIEIWGMGASTNGSHSWTGITFSNF